MNKEDLLQELLADLRPGSSNCKIDGQGCHLPPTVQTLALMISPVANW
jgi:hypothetical protein